MHVARLRNSFILRVFLGRFFPNSELKSKMSSSRSGSGDPGSRHGGVQSRASRTRNYKTNCLKVRLCNKLTFLVVGSLAFDDARSKQGLIQNSLGVVVP